jgi:hypothetical protein
VPDSLVGMAGATESSAVTVVVWRLPVALWAVASIGFAALPLLALYGIVQNPDDLFAWVAVPTFGALGVFNANRGRRSCELDGRQLRGKGRFAARTVELSDLRQAGLGFGGVWVRTHHPLDRRGGTFLYLRMIPTSNFTISGYPAGQQAVDLIRARATAAGAELDPPLTKQTRPRSRKPLIFSI